MYRIFVFSLLAASLFAAELPLRCTANAGVPPIIRAEGVAELAGDLVVDCTGGQAGQQMTLDLRIAANTSITSPVHGGASDALVIVDEHLPGFSLQPGVNMFRADEASAAANQLEFTGVKITAPGSATTALRFTNIPVNATGLGLGTTLIPTQVVFYITTPPTLPIDNPQQTVGYLRPGYSADLRTAANGGYAIGTLNAAAGLNTGLLDGNPAGATPQFLVRFTEGFQTAFKGRSEARASEPPTAQNTPGNVYYTETGFYAPELPAAGEWNTVGLASSGTRLMARFSGIPAGASLYVSTTPWPGTTAGAALVSTDTSGAGAYTPVAATMTTQINGTSVGLVALPVTGGAATAVWEVNNDPAMSLGALDAPAFGVFLAYRAGTITPQTTTVQMSLAPTGDTGIPRFLASASQTLFALVPAGNPAPDLVPMIHLPSYAPTLNLVQGWVSVKNQGQGYTLNPSKVRVQLFPSATSQTPSGQPFDCTIPNALAAGATSPACGFSLIAATAGTYYIRATADVDGAIPETVETNNVLNTAIAVSPCAWQVSPAAFSLPASAGSKQLAIETQSGCPNSYPTLSGWTVTGPQSGPGTATLTYSANATTATRTESFTISQKPIVALQAPAGCSYTFSTKTVNLNPQGETKSVQVTTGFNCPVVPESSADWLTANASVLNGPSRIDITAPQNTGQTKVAAITVLDQVIQVTQFPANDTQFPFGVVDIPLNNATGITGALPVSGWALDNSQVSKIEIWRDPVPGEASSAKGVYIGIGIFVDGARPDVATAHPNMPFNTRGGWGMQILTNMLPNRGNGTYKLHVWAFDHAGNATKIGERVVTCNNNAAIKPFGTIDTPESAGTVSGTYHNYGWALTPMPHSIPVNGSTIWVFLDGQSIGHPIYNLYRPDIATLFPGLANTNGGVGAYILDTTRLANGMHSLAWSVTDSAGRIDGIGSRLFFVNNSPVTPSSSEPESKRTQFRASARDGVWMRTGYDLEAPLQRVEEVVEVRQADRLELHLPQGITRVNTLPVGSILQNGVFYWQVEPAFLGDYDLRFEGEGEPVLVRVRVVPR